MERNEPTNTPGRPRGTPKTGGRQKGTPNKVTKTAREMLAKFVNRNMRTLQKDFDKLDPADRVRMLEKFMQYIVPKQSNIKAEITDLNADEVNNVARRLLESLNDRNDERND